MVMDIKKTYIFQLQTIWVLVVIVKLHIQKKIIFEISEKSDHIAVF